MTSGGEIIGDIAQGAMLSRAAEPEHGEGQDDGHTHERACLNCGTVLIGSHCHACGQAAHVHRTLGAFFHDLLHGVFHFEGKIWRTLPLLAWRPGKLTREYIDGRRASYVSPIALFLFVVFLSFAVFNAMGDAITVNNTAAAPAEVQGGMAQAREEAEQELAKLEARLADARAGKGGDVALLEREVENARKAVLVIEAAQSGKLPAEIAAGSGRGGEAAAKSFNQAWEHLRENPELIAYKMQTSAYKFAWLVIPLSVPFLWLLLPFNRRFHLYDHTVFVTYSVSFQLILLALVGVLATWGEGTLLPALLLAYSPFHMYRQVREAYGLTRFAAWWRTWFLTFFATFVLVLFATGVTLYAAAG